MRSWESSVAGLLISRIDMVLDHFLCLVGKIPHEVGHHEGKEDGMVVRGLLEESPVIPISSVAFGSNIWERGCKTTSHRHPAPNFEDPRPD